MKLSEWFDVNNKDHLVAFRYLEKHGHVPVGFVPDNVEFDLNWQFMVTAKMAKAWMNHMLFHTEPSKAPFQDYDDARKFLANTTAIEEDGDLIVKYRIFEIFDWPTYLITLTGKWKFKCQEIMDSKDSGRFSGKARYTKVKEV